MVFGASRRRTQETAAGVPVRRGLLVVLVKAEVNAARR
jgi:hypothetical protein